MRSSTIHFLDYALMSQSSSLESCFELLHWHGTKTRLVVRDTPKLLVAFGAGTNKKILNTCVRWHLLGQTLTR